MDEQQLNYLFRLAESELRVDPTAPHSASENLREDSLSPISDAEQQLDHQRDAAQHGDEAEPARHRDHSDSDRRHDWAERHDEAATSTSVAQAGVPLLDLSTVELPGESHEQDTLEAQQRERILLSESERLREAASNAIAQLTTAAGGVQVAQILNVSTPKQTQEIAVTGSQFADLVPDTLQVRWEELVAGVWIEIKAAHGFSFIPGRAHVGHQIRVVVSYTDGAGQTHTVVSVATDPVQKLAVGSGTDLDKLQAPERLQAADFAPVVLSETLSTAANADIVSQSSSTSLRTTIGTDGPDFLSGGATADLIIGNAGNDTLIGGAGKDVLLGGKGNDTFLATVNDDNDIIDGGDDTDTYDLSLTSAAASVDLSQGTSSSAETGDDKLSSIENVIGSAGNDTIVGADGDNVLTGGAGNDVMLGGDGEDTFRATINDGNDRIDGGGDSDTYDLSQTSADATIDLAQGTSSSAETGVDKLNSIENVVGGAGNDILVGSEGANVLAGGAGDDVLDGGAGDDTLIGGTGDDIYVVDSLGDIIIELSDQGTDTIQTTLSTFSLAELVTVEDLFFTGEGNFVGTGNSLANVISGGCGSDTLSGGDGDDTLDGSGSTGANTSNSGSGSSNSGPGSDHIEGGSGNDIIIGGVGNDYLSGGSGDDIIIAGAGDDYIELGSGNDTIVLSAGFGNDFVIDNFDAQGLIGHQDMIDVTSYGFNAETAFGSDILIGMTDDGSTTITIGSDVLTLHGVGPGAISQTDFLFA